MNFPIPDNDSDRLKALYEYEILDTPRETIYDEISQMVAELTGSAIGYISFIDKERQWMKSTFALPDDFCEVPREVAFCNVTICKTSVNEIPDLREHDILGSHEFVTGEPGFRYYCGAPLITSDGFVLGTLCVLDFECKTLALETLEMMRKLAHQVVSQLEQHKSLRRIKQHKEQLAKDQQESDHLLHNILPVTIAAELKQQQKVATKLHNECSLLFADFVNFTQMTREQEPAQLIATLDQYFSTFDQLTEQLKLEKIKTIGDAYLVAAGIPEWQPDHAVQICLLALRMLAYTQRSPNPDSYSQEIQPNWPIRITVHSGTHYAGLVGKKKFCYDLWGDGRQHIEKMQLTTLANTITVSNQTALLIQPFFQLADNPLNPESKQLIGLKPEYQADTLERQIKAGYLPRNEV